MEKHSLKGILNHYFPTTFQSLHLPYYQIKALGKYQSCRTEKLGGHAQYCEKGHLNGIWYNSCKHRGCPQCQGIATEQWLRNTQNILLDCSHHHIIFTIPSELHTLWQYNRELMGNLLFKATQDTIKQFSKDPRYLNATPGFLSTLHTWGRNLSLHPHIHLLITHGGLNKTGEWIEPKKKHLFPQKPLMMVFRGKLLSYLLSALNDHVVILPVDQKPYQVNALFNSLKRKPWVVHCCKRYDHASGVAKYLARYVKSGPLKSSQIKSSTDGRITFQYHSHQTKKKALLALDVKAFIQRLAQHAPLPNKPTVRYGGLYSSSARKRLNQARGHLKQSSVSERE
jgi:Putative transposase/Transposase zinc-binding domain